MNRPRLSGCWYRRLSLHIPRTGVQGSLELPYIDMDALPTAAASRAQTIALLMEKARADNDRAREAAGLPPSYDEARRAKDRQAEAELQHELVRTQPMPVVDAVGVVCLCLIVGTAAAVLLLSRCRL